MITVEFVLGLIFLAVALTSFVFGLVLMFVQHEPNWLWGFIPVVFFLFCGACMVSETPRTQDVLNGKAHYVEVYHTYGNDTIKTYEIDWNQKTGGIHR